MRTSGQRNAAEGADGRNEFWRQRSWLFAAGFLVTALIVSVVSFASGGGARSSAAETAARPPSRVSAERCRQDTPVRGGKPVVPGDLDWRTVGTTRVPVSPSQGPRVTDGPLLRCFARSPMGAVLASQAITAQMSTSDWRSAATHQVMPGFGRNIFTSQRASLTDDDVRGSDTGTYEGFWVSSYSLEKAEVQLLFKSSGGYLAATTVSLRWSDGDWKIQPGVDGSLYGEVSQVDSADGFIAWKRA